MDKMKILRFINNFNSDLDNFDKIYPNNETETIKNIDRILLELYYSNLIKGIIPSRKTTQENPVLTIDIYKLKLTSQGKELL